MCFRPGDASVVNKPVVCPQCGEDNPPGEPNCIFCGTSLLDDPTNAGMLDVPPVAPPQAPAAPAAPQAPAAPAAPKAPAAPAE